MAFTDEEYQQELLNPIPKSKSSADIGSPQHPPDYAEKFSYEKALKEPVWGRPSAKPYSLSDAPGIQKYVKTLKDRTPEQQQYLADIMTERLGMRVPPPVQSSPPAGMASVPTAPETVPKVPGRAENVPVEAKSVPREVENVPRPVPFAPVPVPKEPEVVPGGFGGEVSAHNVLQNVLTEHPGLQKVHNLNETSAVFASPSRLKAATEASKEWSTGGPGHLEYWPKEESGTKDFPHPTQGKGNVLEIYDQGLKNDPEALHPMIMGDLLHGMTKDPGWAKLREEFKANYSPEAQKVIEQRKGQDDFVSPDSTVDAFIRGGLVPYKGGNWIDKNPGMYSPKQLQILDQMKQYLGEAPGRGALPEALAPTRQPAPAPVAEPVTNDPGEMAKELARPAFNMVSGMADIAAKGLTGLFNIPNIVVNAVTGSEIPMAKLFSKDKGAIEEYLDKSLAQTPGKSGNIVSQVVGGLLPFLIAGGAVAEAKTGMTIAELGSAEATTHAANILTKLATAPIKHVVDTAINFGLVTIPTAFKEKGVEGAMEALKRLPLDSAIFAAAGGIPGKAAYPATGLAFAGSAALAGQRDPMELAKEFAIGVGIHTGMGIIKRAGQPREMTDADWDKYTHQFIQENKVTPEEFQEVKSKMEEVTKQKNSGGKGTVIGEAPPEAKPVLDQFGNPAEVDKVQATLLDPETRAALAKPSFERNASEKLLADQVEKQAKASLEPEKPITPDQPQGPAGGAAAKVAAGPEEVVAEKRSAMVAGKPVVVDQPMGQAGGRSAMVAAVPEKTPAPTMGAKEAVSAKDAMAKRKLMNQGKIQSWELTQDEYSVSKKWGTRTEETRRYNHQIDVERALAAGKPVPPEVLADYPDLAAKQTPTPDPLQVGEGKAETKFSVDETPRYRLADLTHEERLEAFKESPLWDGLTKEQQDQMLHGGPEGELHPGLTAFFHEMTAPGMTRGMNKEMALYPPGYLERVKMFKAMGWDTEGIAKDAGLYREWGKEDLQRFYGTGVKVSELPDGTLEATFPSGVKGKFNKVGEIVLDQAGLESLRKTYGYESGLPEGKTIAGEFYTVDAGFAVNMVTGKADQVGTLAHEGIGHMVFDVFATPREQKALLKKWGDVEGAANGLGKEYLEWLSNGGKVGEAVNRTLFQKIKDFFTKFLDAVHPTWRSVMREMQSGEMFAREPQGGPPEALAPERYRVKDVTDRLKEEKEAAEGRVRRVFDYLSNTFTPSRTGKGGSLYGHMDIAGASAEKRAEIVRMTREIGDHDAKTRFDDPARHSPRPIVSSSRG